MSGEKLSLFASIPVNKRPKTDNEAVFKEMVTLITNKQISTGKLVDFSQLVKDMASAGIVISGNQVAIKGDKVTIYNARFIYEGKGVQVRRHRLMKVDFENCSYITDVSFRLESPRQALKFVYDEIQTDSVCEYKLTQNECYSNILWQRLL